MLESEFEGLSWRSRLPASGRGPVGRWPDIYSFICVCAHTIFQLCVQLGWWMMCCD
eukprot:SAG31_NODE_47997_length_201_cov_77.931373_1_plen_55_part_01